MNNLEIIEFEMSILKSYPGYSTIISTAKRMAAEIEQFKKANSGLAETFGGLSNEIIYYKHEIARLKAELEKLQPIATSCNGNDENIRQITHLIKRAIIEGRENEECNLYWIQCWDLLREIKQLKAELEKRPEVVRCGECKHWHPIELLENNYSLMKTQGPCMIRKDNTYFYEDDFCSRGQRRESEEK